MIVSGELKFHSEYLDDIESARIAVEGRLRALVQAALGTEQDLSGKKLIAAAESLGVPYTRYAPQLTALVSIEHEAELALKRAVRTHPYAKWIKSRKGIGEKQGARLIACIEDPYWNYAEDRPRRDVAELWAYCGYVPGQRRKRGERSNWNPVAKSRAFLCAVACLKTKDGEFGSRYDGYREKYAESVHVAPCPQCGPKDHPALEGSSLSAGHQHARALRLIAKDVLEDLWEFAQDVGQM